MALRILYGHQLKNLPKTDPPVFDDDKRYIIVEDKGSILLSICDYMVRNDLDRQALDESGLNKKCHCDNDKDIKNQHKT